MRECIFEHQKSQSFMGPQGIPGYPAAYLLTLLTQYLFLTWHFCLTITLGPPFRAGSATKFLRSISYHDQTSLFFLFCLILMFLSTLGYCSILSSLVILTGCPDSVVYFSLVYSLLKIISRHKI